MTYKPRTGTKALTVSLLRQAEENFAPGEGPDGGSGRRSCKLCGVTYKNTEKARRAHEATAVHQHLLTGMRPSVPMAIIGDDDPTERFPRG